MSQIGPFVSYAPHGEDVVLWRALGARDHVSYVDLGVTDPTHESVTRALYDRGWRGVNLVAREEELAAFELERPDDTNLVLASSDEDPAWEDDLSVLRGLDLDDVDVLRTDTGAAEIDVVRGLLAGGVRPSVCVVRGDGTSALLVESGYAHCMFDGLNHYLTDDPTLQGHLSVPANPTDDFVTDLVSRLSGEREALTSSIAALARENELLRRTSSGGPATLDVTGEVTGVAVGQAPVAPSTTPAAATSDAPPATVAPEVRAERRRATFGQVIAGESDQPLVDLPGTQLPWVVELHSGRLDPADAVEVLYRGVLGRAADPGGLQAWVGRVQQGEDLFDLAREMAASDEAQARTRSDVALVEADLVTWERIIAGDAIGLGSWRSRRRESPRTAGHRIFVDALFEVSMQRSPRPKERAHEVARLIAGAGRETLLQEYAARPETDRHLFGVDADTGGVRHRVKSIRERRQRLEVFRDLVTAAESRLRMLLLIELSQSVPEGARARVRRRRKR